MSSSSSKGSPNPFPTMSDAQLRAHADRLAYLAGTSEETDEYASLLGREQAAREELQRRASRRASDNQE